MVTATGSFKGNNQNLYLSNRTQTYVKLTLPQFLGSCLTNRSIRPDRDISRTRLNDCGGIFCGKGCGFQSLTDSERSPSWMFGRFLNPPLKSILMTLYYLYHHLFFLLGAPLSIQRISVASYFQEKAPS